MMLVVKIAHILFAIFFSERIVVVLGKVEMGIGLKFRSKLL